MLPRPAARGGGAPCTYPPGTGESCFSNFCDMYPQYGDPKDSSLRYSDPKDSDTRYSDPKAVVPAPSVVSIGYF